MNEKQVILDFLESEEYVYLEAGEYDQKGAVDNYLASKQPKEEDQDWFLHTHWTENQA